MNRLVPFFLLVISLAACSPFKEVQCTGVKGFTVNSINTSGINGDVLLGIKNPNRFKFTIYKSEFDVTYSGVHLGKARLAKNVRINGNTEEVYAFNLQSDFKDVSLGDILKLLNGATVKGNIEVRGDLKAGRFFIRKKIPVNVVEKIRFGS
jgi:LEA14-like dessication related protein